MPIEYVQKQYYWIPRRGGQDPIIGQPYANTGGGIPAAWISDIETLPQPVPDGYFPLVFPSWFPRKCLINRIWFWGMTIYPGQVELALWIDPRGQGYFSTTPPGREYGSDMTRDISLGHLVIYGPDDFRELFDFKHPVAFDRDAGDRMIYLVSGSAAMDFVGAGIGYLERYIPPNL